MPGQTLCLPVTVTPADQEVLDSYLTRVAHHNELTHRELATDIAPASDIPPATDAPPPPESHRLPPS